VAPSEITPEQVYFDRRKLLQAALAAGVAGIAGQAWPTQSQAAELAAKRNDTYSTDEKPNTYEEITTYNNYYEFGTDKSDPAANSGKFKAQPWTVEVSGEAETTGKFALEDLLKPHASRPGRW
jgi:sulfoxide reductase catalytic subunit YedY